MPTTGGCSRASSSSNWSGLAKVESRLVGEMDAHFRLKDKIEALGTVTGNGHGLMVFLS